MEPQRWGLMIYREVLVAWFTFIRERYSLAVRVAAAVPKPTGNTCAQTAHLPGWKTCLGKLGVWNSGLTVTDPAGTTQPSKENIHAVGTALSLFSCTGKTWVRCSCVGPVTGLRSHPGEGPSRMCGPARAAGLGMLRAHHKPGSSTRAPLTFP